MRRKIRWLDSTYFVFHFRFFASVQEIFLARQVGDLYSSMTTSVYEENVRPRPDYDSTDTIGLIGTTEP